MWYRDARRAVTWSGVPSGLVEAGLEEVRSPTDVEDRLSPPRSVFSCVPAGPAVEEVPDDLAEELDDDTPVDGETVLYPGLEAGDR